MQTSSWQSDAVELQQASKLGFEFRWMSLIHYHGLAVALFGSLHSRCTWPRSKRQGSTASDAKHFIKVEMSAAHSILVDTTSIQASLTVWRQPKMPQP